MSEDDDVVANAIASAAQSPSYDEVSASSAAWWADFWNQSYIYLPSQQNFEQRRNYYMYLAAISNRGSILPNITAGFGLPRKTGVTGAASIGTGTRIPSISLLWRPTM